MSDTSLFSKLSDDILLSIFFKLENDPRNWARLACVCTKFSAIIRNICWKDKCNKTIPSFVSDLLSSSDPSIPGGWSALFKLSVCCPGLLHAGVLLEHSDFGLERELGPDDNYQKIESFTSKRKPQPQPQPQPSSSTVSNGNSENCDCSWSLFDDLYFDTVYDVSEAQGGSADAGAAVNDDKTVGKADGNFSICKRRKISRSLRSHLASGVWNLTREQGNKLLASRFRDDCLYICDWPGCVHIEEKRNYMLFRGVFKNFKRSRVWRTVNDADRSKINLNCAFCGCKETWDLLAAFCLRRAYGYHEDGEPVVRAYVCENGHVSGAWTDLPLYT
ncbi:hypothetical protein JCGZ_13927 [Jatropha curcas]|uniref:F-box domain-containing protein n=1 Tax=Jatropha curcas TaxID=180498 RepID=A0A067JW12_JATCU|nr:phytochrome A-associated F-box protein [Jatropha curcas]KDP28156.1 hypothetical protein JCGZ_13927 [Jatropha curcas]